MERAYPLTPTLSPSVPHLAMAAHRPNGEHDDDDRDELKQNPQSHQFLGAVRRAAPHHVEKTEQQHQRDRGHRDGDNESSKERSHLLYITLQKPIRHCRLAAHDLAFGGIISEGNLVNFIGAANLKFLSISPRVRYRTSKFSSPLVEWI